MEFRKRLLPYIFIALAASVIFSWYSLSLEGRGTLTVAFLDVGQGDAIYIESPTGVQVIVDGGPNAALLRELAKVMPLYDRSLDALIVTNPDADHLAGFIDVLNRFEVAVEIEPGTKKDTAVYQTLQRTLKEKEVQQIIARRGMTLDLGDGALLHILYPDKDVAELSPNDGSIVASLVYGETRILLMGDATARVETRLLQLASSTAYRTDVLKIGHHGSKTSSSQNWLAAASPAWAVISVGEGNRYGLPSPEITSRLQSNNIPYLETAREGTVIFESDGESLVRR